MEVDFILAFENLLAILERENTSSSSTKLFEPKDMMIYSVEGHYISTTIILSS